MKNYRAYIFPLILTLSCTYAHAKSKVDFGSMIKEGQSAEQALREAIRKDLPQEKAITQADRAKATIRVTEDVKTVEVKAGDMFAYDREKFQIDDKNKAQKMVDDELLGLSDL